MNLWTNIFLKKKKNPISNLKNEQTIHSSLKVVNSDATFIFSTQVKVWIYVISSLLTSLKSVCIFWACVETLDIRVWALLILVHTAGSRLGTFSNSILCWPTHISGEITYWLDLSEGRNLLPEPQLPLILPSQHTGLHRSTWHHKGWGAVIGLHL